MYCFEESYLRNDEEVDDAVSDTASSKDPATICDYKLIPMKYLHVFIIYRELQQHNALKDPKNALVMKAAKESNKMDLADVMKVDCV